MKNPTKKSQGLVPTEGFDRVLASALKKRYFEDPKIHVWIESFVWKVRPLLEELYGKYGVPTDLVVVWSAICKFSPVPKQFPKRLRNRRQRERMAASLEKAADIIYDLQLVKLYGISLVSDPTINIPVRAAAARVRRVKSVSGRPQNRIMKDYASYLAELFRFWSVSPLYPPIAKLLKATFPEDWGSAW